MLLIVGIWDYWIGIVVIAVLHLMIDLWKISFQTNQNVRQLFFVDQTMHLMVIVAVAEYYTGFINDLVDRVDYDHLLLLLLCLILVTVVSSHIVRVLISRWEPEQEDTSDDSLSDAGSYIGMLERLFIFGFVVSNHLSAVGFLLAAKSIFRFGDLSESKDRKLTEYILIGTLLSFGIAMMISLFYKKILLQIS